MRVLIAYASKRGGTAGLARMMADEFAAVGVDAVVEKARDVSSLDGSDAVVIAGALYANRWHRDARRFARRFAAELRRRPVWLVSSGPLDSSATTREIGPVPHVRRIMARIGARGQVTFGGRLEADASGFVAGKMAKRMAGDWRDPDHVRRWTETVADELIRLNRAA